MEFSHSFPSVTFAVTTVGQFIERGVRPYSQCSRDSHAVWRIGAFRPIYWKNQSSLWTKNGWE